LRERNLKDNCKQNQESRTQEDLVEKKYLKKTCTHIFVMGLISKLLVGLAGFYAGVYCDQQYKLPKVSEPAQLLDEVNKWLEDLKNDQSK